MDFSTLVRERAATKRFDSRTISPELMHELSELIRFAPSSFNLQPWKIYTITDQEKKEALLPYSFNQPQITSCSHLLVFCADADIYPLIDKLEQLLRTTGHSDDHLAALTGIMRTYFRDFTAEQRAQWAQRQVYLALENALLGAAALGFAACPMEGFVPEEYRRLLHIPPSLTPTVLCTLGYPAGGEDVSHEKVRFPAESIFL